VSDERCPKKAPEKCPFCGEPEWAQFEEYRDFLCDTVYVKGELKQGGVCALREAPALRADNARLQGEVDRLRGVVEAQKRVIEGQSDLLVAYRLGSHARADKALTKLEKAKSALAALEVGK
jgi:hypothetical protein